MRHSIENEKRLCREMAGLPTVCRAVCSIELCIGTLPCNAHPASIVARADWIYRGGTTSRPNEFASGLQTIRHPTAMGCCTHAAASTPGDVKFGKCIGSRQGVLMTVELRAVETTCRSLTGNAYLLESQFLHDAPARLVSLEVPDADCLRAKVAEGVTNSCVCGLRSHTLSGVFRCHPISSFIDVWLIGNIQCGSNDEVPVEPMESGQCDSCLTLVIHRSSNRVFHRLP